MKFERVSLAVATAGFCTFLNLYTPQAILPSLAATFHVPQPRTALSVTASLLAVALVAPFAGVISDRLGRKRLIVAACMLVILPTAMVAFSQSLEGLLLWRFVQGLLLPFIFTVTMAYISEELDGPAAIKAAGLYSSGAILGGVSGRMVAGVAADLGGWRLGFLAVAALTAAAGLFLSLALPKETRFRPGQPGVGAILRDWGEHIVNPWLLGTCIVGFGMLFSVVATFTFVNFYLAAPPFTLSPSALASVFAVYLVGAITTPLATRAAVGIGRVRATLIGLAVSIGGELLTLLPSVPAVVVGLTMASAGLFVAQAIGLGFIGIAVKRARSTAVGLYVSIYYIGGALGAVLPAAVWHRAGWAGCVALLCSVMLVMAVTAMFTFRHRPSGGV